MRRRKGDTLLEVVIALAILTALLSVASIGAIRSFRNADLARERTTAYYLANRQAEALRAYARSMDWDSFAPFITNDNAAPWYFWPCYASYSTCYYPGGVGYSNPNLTAAEISTLATKDGQVGAPGHFFMGKKSGCNCWALSPDLGNGPHLAAYTDGIFTITITGNPAAPSTFSVDQERDLFRFDIRVYWQSQNSHSTNRYEESALVVYIGKSQGVGQGQ